MLYWLTEFTPELPFFNVFRYITFRTGGALLTALLFVFLFGPQIIKSLRIRQGKGQPIRKEGPERHLLQKQGTPTMGGLMILSGVTVAVLLWGNLRNPYVWVVLFLTLVYGAVGLYDDYLKVTKQSAEGFRGHRRGRRASARHRACHPLLQIRRDRSRLVLHSLRRLYHRRRRQRREPDRRAGRLGHCAGDDRRRHLRLHFLPRRQRCVCRLFADPFCRWHWRTCSG